MNKENPTFFLVKNRALGDSIMGISTVSYLRRIYPKSTIIYATTQWTAQLYQEVEIEADLIYPLRLNTLRDIWKLYRDLFKFKVDFIHEMHQSGRGSKVFSLFSFFTRIPYSFHNHHLNKKTKVIDQGEKKELIQRDLDGVYSYYGNSGIAPSFLDFEPKIELKKKTILKKNRIIFGVVATRQTKMWPIENYLELAKLILGTDPEIEIVIPLSNSTEDLKIRAEIERINQNSKIQIVQIPLNKLPEFFYESKAYIGNDTGLKHLAVACSLPTITLFGPEPIREWHPYNLKNHKALFIENLKCRTRVSHYCGLSVCDLDNKLEFMQCMKGHGMEKVFEIFKLQIES